MSEPNRGNCLIIDQPSGGEWQLNIERLCFSGLMRSVDYWPLAKIFTRYLGVDRSQ